MFPIDQILKDHSWQLRDQTLAVFHYNFKFYQILSSFGLITENLLSFLIGHDDVIDHGKLSELSQDLKSGLFFGGKFIVKIVP